MAKIEVELSNTLERVVQKFGKNPWQWKGQIVCTGLTVQDRMKLGMNPLGGGNEVVSMSGVIDPEPDANAMRRKAVDILQAKASEMRELIQIPKMEKLVLKVNDNCKEKLTTLDSLNAKPTA